MIQTLPPYTTTAKTAEIMARYRPIAPKPEAGAANSMNDTSSLPQSIRRSPYLRNVWPHLQARPTRTRKRGRTALALPSVKRARSCLQGVAPSFQVPASPAKTLALQGFVHAPNGLPQVSVIPNLVPLQCGLEIPVTTPSNLVTLPLLPCTAPLPVRAVSNENSPESSGAETCKCKEVIDLNEEAEVPEEMDFMKQMQEPRSPGVITPRAVRPVGSTITIGLISEDPGGQLEPLKEGLKNPEDVEKEVESKDLPVVVSDSNNKVRLENSAYKEMVGQPECCWLDYMSRRNDSNQGRGACQRIGGEVLLQFLDSTAPISSNGFTCNVKIEWGRDGKRNSVSAFCEATRLGCNRDYVFEWKFHIKEASESASEA